MKKILSLKHTFLAYAFMIFAVIFALVIVSSPKKADAASDEYNLVGQTPSTATNGRDGGGGGVGGSGSSIADPSYNNWGMFWFQASGGAGGWRSASTGSKHNTSRNQNENPFIAQQMHGTYLDNSHGTNSKYLHFNYGGSGGTTGNDNDYGNGNYGGKCDDSGSGGSGGKGGSSFYESNIYDRWTGQLLQHIETVYQGDAYIGTKKSSLSEGLALPTSGRGGWSGNGRGGSDRAGVSGGGGGGGAAGVSGEDQKTSTNSIVTSSNTTTSVITITGGSGGSGGKGGLAGKGADGGPAAPSYACKKENSGPGSGGGGGGGAGGMGGKSAEGGSASLTYSNSVTVKKQDKPPAVTIKTGSNGSTNAAVTGSGIGGNGGGGSGTYSQGGASAGGHGKDGTDGTGRTGSKGGDAKLVFNNSLTVNEPGLIYNINATQQGDAILTLFIKELVISNSATVNLNVNCPVQANCNISIETLRISDNGKFKFKNMAGNGVKAKLKLGGDNIDTSVYIDKDSESNLQGNDEIANIVRKNGTSIVNLLTTATSILRPTLTNESPARGADVDPSEMKSGSIVALSDSDLNNAIRVKFSRKLVSSGVAKTITLSGYPKTDPAKKSVFNLTVGANGATAIQSDAPTSSTVSAPFVNGTSIVFPLSLFKCTQGCTIAPFASNQSPLQVDGKLPMGYFWDVTIPEDTGRTVIEVASARRSNTAITYRFSTRNSYVKSVDVSVKGQTQDPVNQTTADIGSEVTFDAKILSIGQTWPETKPQNPYSSLKWEVLGAKSSTTSIAQNINYENTRSGQEFYDATRNKYSISRATTEATGCRLPTKTDWYGCISENVETVRNTLKISQGETAAVLFIVARSTFTNEAMGFAVVTVTGRVKTNLDIVQNNFEAPKGVQTAANEIKIDAILEVPKGSNNKVNWELSGSTTTGSGATGLYLNSLGSSSASSSVQTSTANSKCVPIPTGTAVAQATKFQCSVFLFVSENENSPILTLRAYSEFSSSTQDFLMINVAGVGILSLAVTPPVAQVNAGSSQDFDVAAMNGSNYQELTPDQYGNLNCYWSVTGATDSRTVIVERTEADGTVHARLTVGEDEMAAQLVIMARNKENDQLYGYSTVKVIQSKSGVINIIEQNLVVKANTTGNVLHAKVVLPPGVDKSLYWQVIGNADPATTMTPVQSTDTSLQSSLTVGNEPAGGALLIVARSVEDTSVFGFSVVQIEKAGLPSIVLNPATVTVETTDTLANRTKTFIPTIVNGANDTKAVVYELVGASLGTTLESVDANSKVISSGDTVQTLCQNLGNKTTVGNAKLIVSPNETSTSIFIRAILCSNQDISTMSEVHLKNVALQSLTLNFGNNPLSFFSQTDSKTAHINQNASTSRVVNFDAAMILPQDEKGIADDDKITFTIEGGSSSNAVCTGADLPVQGCTAPTHQRTASDPTRATVLDRLTTSRAILIDPNESASQLLVRACSAYNTALCDELILVIDNRNSTGITISPRLETVNVGTNNAADREVDFSVGLTIPSNKTAQDVAGAGAKWVLSGNNSTDTRLVSKTDLSSSCDEGSGTRTTLTNCVLIVSPNETATVLVVQVASLYESSRVDFAKVQVDGIISSGLSIKKFDNNVIYDPVASPAVDDRIGLNAAVGNCYPISASNYSNKYTSSKIIWKIDAAIPDTQFFKTQADCNNASSLNTQLQEMTLDTTGNPEEKISEIWLYVSQNESSENIKVSACIQDNLAICDYITLATQNISNSGLTLSPPDGTLTTGQFQPIVATVNQPPGTEKYIFWTLEGSSGASQLIDQDYYDQTGKFRDCSVNSYTDANDIKNVYGSNHDFTKCTLYVSPDETSHLLTVVARLNFDAQQRFMATYKITGQITTSIYLSPAFYRATPGEDISYFGENSLPSIPLTGLSQAEIDNLNAEQEVKKKAIEWSLGGSFSDSYLYHLEQNGTRTQGCEDISSCYLHVGKEQPNGTIRIVATSKLNRARNSVALVDVRDASTSGIKACSEKEMGEEKVVGKDLTTGDDIVEIVDFTNCSNSAQVAAGESFKLVTEYSADPSDAYYLTHPLTDNPIFCDVFGNIKETTTSSDMNGECIINVSKDEIASELHVEIRSKIKPMRTDRFTLLITKRATNGVQISPKTDVKVMAGSALNFSAIVRDLGCRDDDDYYYDTDSATDDLESVKTVDKDGKELGPICGDGSVEWLVRGNVKETKISENGTLTVSENETAKFLTVIAKSKYDPTRIDVAVVQITDRQTMGIRVFPLDPTISVGGSSLFSAEVALPELMPIYDEDGNEIEQEAQDESVEWSLLGGNTKSIIDKTTGLLQISPDELAQTLVVMARSNYDKTLIGTSTVKVADIVNPKVEITTEEQNLVGGDTLQIETKVDIPKNQDSSLTWQLIGNTSEFTTISGNGTLFVANDEESKSLVIIARSNWNPSLSDSVTMHVNRDLANQYDYSKAEDVNSKIMDAQKQIVLGGMPTFIKRSNSDLSFATGADYSNYSQVLVDGEVLQENYYSVLKVSGDYLMQNPETFENSVSAGAFRGSLNKYNYYTMITLKASYLDTIELGDHHFKIDTPNVEINSVPFRVVDVNFNSKASQVAGFFANNWPFLTLLLLILLGLGIYYVLTNRDALKKKLEKRIKNGKAKNA